MVNVGIIGIGGMGRMHFNCYKNNPNARIVAICDIDEKKRAGDWSSIGLNIDTSKSEAVDLSGIKTYTNAEELIADADVQLVDICLPTPLHAEAAIAALKASKDVLCEKPMALTLDQCAQVEAVYEQTGRKLLIGHCLRYWPQYVKAGEVISGGEYGKPLYARFHRSGDTPIWSWDNWLADGGRSGGAVLDMHIHDVDTALWWFGRPDKIQADGVIIDGLPVRVDATWRYNDGPLVYIHGGWDNNGGPFRMSFEVVLENATVAWDSSKGDKVELRRREGTEEIEVADTLAYQAEIDDMVAAVSEGRDITRVTPASSRVSVEVALEELRQIAANNP
jgi:predicted dehydrogenase